MRSKSFLAVILLVAFAASSCTLRQQVKSAPVSPEKNSKKSAKGKAPGTEAYTVAHGDNLWVLSEKLYGDSFQWPLLFTGNQDVIKDPDLIYAGQKVHVQNDVKQEEKISAAKKARATPRY